MTKFSPFKQITLILFSIQLVILGLSAFSILYFFLHLENWHSWFKLVFLQSPVVSNVTEVLFIDTLLFCYIVATVCIVISYIKLEFMQRQRQMPMFILYSILASLFAASAWFVAESLASHDVAIYDTLSFYILFLLMLVYIESQYKFIRKKQKFVFSVYSSIKYFVIVLPAIILLLNFLMRNWSSFDRWQQLIATYLQGSPLEPYTIFCVYLSLLFPIISVACFVFGFLSGELIFGREKPFLRAGFVCIIIFISLAYFIARIMEVRRDFEVVASFLDRTDDQYQASFVLNYTLNQMILYLLASISALLLLPAKNK